jgi:hypothetical protein
MTQVIIDDILPLTQIVSTAGQTVYSTDWTVNFPSDVVVYYTPIGVAANDVTQILSPSQYNVALIGDELTVQVTLVTPAINTGDLVTITRQTPADRENLYTNTNFTPSMLNNDFGILTLVDQQNQLVDQQRAPHYNYSALVSLPLDIILPILGANQLWVKNPTNTAIVAGTIPAGGLAPADDSYVLLTPDANLPNSIALSTLPAGFIVNDLPTNTITTTLILGTTNQIAVTNSNGLGGGTILSIAPNPIIPGTAGVGIPIGTTAERVIPIGNINLRYNTDLGSLEYYNGTAWVQLNDGSNVQPGLINELAWYAANGSTVSGLPTATSAVLTTVLGVPTWGLELSLALGGTNANLTASIGGIVYSTASQLAILSGTSTALLPLLSGNLAAPVWGAFPLSLGGALTTAAALTTAGAFNTTFTFTGATNVTFPQTGTLATTSLLPTYPLSPSLGGTGINNGSNTITLGGSLTTAGAFNATFNFVGATNVTFPTTGTLATTSQLGIVTINGDTGSVTGTTVSINANTTAGSSVSFSGSGTTLSLNLTDSLANTILGKNAGNTSISGTDNIGVGGISFFALTTGFSNVSIGYSSSALLTTGSNNVFVGQGSGAKLTSGVYNIIIGGLAGNNYTSSESSNILLNNLGIVGESNTLRISSSGTGNQQVSTAYIGGIFGVTLAGTPSLVTSVTGDQLGTATIGSGLTLSGGILSASGGSTSNAQIQVTAITTNSLTGTYNNGTAGVGATFTLTATGTLTIDNITVVLNGLYLFNQQVSAFQNGIYLCTTAPAVGVQGVFTRSTLYNTPALVASNISILALTGTANAGLLYGLTIGVNNFPVVIGTTTLTYDKFAFFSGNSTTSIFKGSGSNILGQLASSANTVLSNSGGSLAFSSTLPAALTIPQPSITGVITVSNAAAGAVGELISNVIPSASAVSLTTSVVSNITTISLTAGDWDVSGNFSITTTGLSSAGFGWTSLSNATQPDTSLLSGLSLPAVTGPDYYFTTPFLRVNVASTTTIYLSAICTFTTGTATACGGIYARRRR